MQTDQGRRQAPTVRIPGLDTLRALAVAVVFGYHAAVPGLRGGFLGVTLFFVISGYLITRLLLEEIETRGTLNLVGFWVRRARRLFPAAYLVVLGSLVWAVLAAPTMLPRLRGDGAAALLYLSNWWMIFHKVSYFESFGLPSPLAHLWTLAIEEQFYLVWPVVLVALLVLVRRKSVIVAVLATAAVCSSTMMALGYQPLVDPSRTYLGTDRRAGELLIGALLAIGLHLVSAKQPELAARWAAPILRGKAPAVLLTGSAATLVLLVSTLSEYSAFAYRGGIALAAIASAGLLLGLQAPAAAGPAAWADRSVVGAVGRRSYSVYLWHFPVLVAFSTPVDFGIYSASRTAVVLVVTLALAEISYRFVEMPIRRHGMGATMRVVLGWVRTLPTAPKHATVLCATALLLVAGMGMVGVGAPDRTERGPESIVEGVLPAASNPEAPRPNKPAATPTPRPDVVPTVPRRLVGSDTVAIGDSLMIDIAARLRERAPGITINAEIGRQPWTGLDIADSYTQPSRGRARTEDLARSTGTAAATSSASAPTVRSMRPRYAGSARATHGPGSS